MLVWPSATRVSHDSLLEPMDQPSMWPEQLSKVLFDGVVLHDLTILESVVND
jgi:hypothetical protein